MKIAARVASVAFALAAIIAMPFAQPAQAQGAPYDIDVTKRFYEAQGAQWKPGEPANGPRWVRSFYRVQNIGGVRTPHLMVYTYCMYNGKWEPAEAVTTSPSLGSGGSTGIYFNCFKQPGGKGWPTGSKLLIVAHGELSSMMHNNEEIIWFDGKDGPIIVG